MSTPSRPAADRAGVSAQEPPIVVVGAGIAGLSAAWELFRRGYRRVLVLEAGARAGGLVQTETADGFVFELGPDSFLTRKTAAAALCQELGLDAQRIACAIPAARTQILRRGKLEPLPEGWQMLAPGRLWPALTTPLLSPAAKLRIAWRALRAPVPAAREESVAEFLRRHCSQEVVTAIAEPLLAGVYGGDPEQLSLAALMPNLLAMDRSRQPLLGQLRRQARAMSREKAPIFTSLRGGMGSLVEALVAQLPADWLRFQCRVARVEAGLVAPGSIGPPWRLHLADGQTLDAAAVILAVPAWAAAELLTALDAELSAALAAIPYRSAVTVNLAYDGPVQLPAGFGFLVPRAEGLAMMACTFVHQKFPHRAPAGGALLRLFFRAEECEPGGEKSGVRRVSGNDADLEATARRELASVLGLQQSPRIVRIARWQRSMAQYTVGHESRLATIEARRARHRNLMLAGNAYRGIGLPDCILSGRDAALEAPDVVTQAATESFDRRRSPVEDRETPPRQEKPGPPPGTKDQPSWVAVPPIGGTAVATERSAVAGLNETRLASELPLLHVVHALYPQSVGGREVFGWELARAIGGAVLTFTSAADTAAVPEWDGLRVFAPAPNETPQAAWHRALDHVRPRAVLVHQLGPVGPALLLDLAERGIPYALYLLDFSPLCPTRKLWHRRQQRCDGPGDTGFKCAWCVSGSLRRMAELPARTLRYQSRLHAWQIALARAEALLVGSRFQREFWLDQGAPPERIAVIPARMPMPAATTAEEPSGPRRRRLLYAGGWESAKGADLLAEALALIDMPVQLEVVGRADTQARALFRAAVPSRHALVFHGVVPPSSMPERIRRCDAVVIPSRWDDVYGRLLSEGFAGGVPVVATAVGGMPERVIHGLNGFLAEPDDSAALAQSLREALTVPEWSGTQARLWAAAEADDARIRLRRFAELLIDRVAEPALVLEHRAFLSRIAECAAIAPVEARDRLVEALRDRPLESPGESVEEAFRRRAYDASLRSRLHWNHALALFHAHGCRTLADLAPGMGEAAAWFRAWGWPTEEASTPLRRCFGSPFTTVAPPEGLFVGRDGVHCDRRELLRRFPQARILVGIDDEEVRAEPLVAG